MYYTVEMMMAEETVDRVNADCGGPVDRVDPHPPTRFDAILFWSTLLGITIWLLL